MIWEMIDAGRWDALMAHYRAVIDSGQASFPDYANLGRLCCYVSDIPQASRCFAKADELVENKLAYAPIVGVVHWVSGRVEAAIDRWSRGIHPKRGGSPNGIDCPALLYFAASRLSDRALRARAERLLRAQHDPRNANIWPWPIASLLLGEIDADTLIDGWEFEDPYLEAKRLYRAIFWSAICHLDDLNFPECRSLMKRNMKPYRPSIEYVRLLQFEWVLGTSLAQHLE